MEHFLDTYGEYISLLATDQAEPYPDDKASLNSSQRNKSMRTKHGAFYDVFVCQIENLLIFNSELHELLELQESDLELNILYKKCLLGNLWRLL